MARWQDFTVSQAMQMIKAVDPNAMVDYAADTFHVHSRMRVLKESTTHMAITVGSASSADEAIFKALEELVGHEMFYRDNEKQMRIYFFWNGATFALHSIRNLDTNKQE